MGEVKGLNHRAHRVVCALALLALVIFLIRVRMILPPFVFAGFIAYVANPPVCLLEARQVPRTTAILVTYCTIVVIVVLFVVLLLPVITREFNEALEGLPTQVDGLSASFHKAVSGFRRIKVPLFLDNIIIQALDRLQELSDQLVRRATETLFGLLSGAAALVISPILAYYLLRDWSSFADRFQAILPLDNKDQILSMLSEINQVLAGFIRGQLLVSLLVGLLITIGLLLTGVKFAVLIGLLAGVFNLIPYFGPVMGAIPALVFALAESPVKALWVIVIFAMANQVESSLLAPRILSERVGLHPLTVIFAVLAGASLLGILGMLLAVPVAAILKILGSYLWRYACFWEG